MRSFSVLSPVLSRVGRARLRRAAPVLIPVLALCAATLASASALPALDDRDTRERREVTTGPWLGVVGHWTDSTMGTAGVVANGERWSGTTARDALERASTRLFGGVDATFVANGSGDGTFPFAVHEPTTSFSTGTLRVQFNMLGGKSDQFAGILLGLTPQGEYHAVRYNTKEGNLAVWQYRNGERAVVARGTVKAQLPLNAWHTLVVTVKGREVHALVEGRPDLSVTHTLEADLTGRVGLWVKRDAITAFRGFEARP